MSQPTSDRRGFITGILGLTGVAVVAVACGSQASPSEVSAAPTSAPAPTAAATSASTAAAQGAAMATAKVEGQVTLTGAGSTFDNPLFSKTFAEYNKANPHVRVNYQSIGSGGGVQQLTNGTVDFGASDYPMTDDQIKAAGGDVVHIPITLGPAAISYNLPGVADGLKLPGPVLADIFLGKIANWNDPAIAQVNPGLTLGDTPIAVAHRSDGSGTTDIFTTYLAAVSPDWKAKVGAGASVNWPVGIGGKGSEGVAGVVKQTPGGIGYFELSYAKQNNLTSAAIGSGDAFYPPSADGASACAAAVATSMPADLRVRIAGCAGPDAYPISGFSWVVLHQAQKDPNRGAALADLLWWMVHDGQSFAKDLFYAPLPSQVVTLNEAKLKSLTANGKPLLAM